MLYQKCHTDNCNLHLISNLNKTNAQQAKTRTQHKMNTSNDNPNLLYLQSNLQHQPLKPTETKLCIIVDSDTPIIMKVPKVPGTLTLGQFKSFAAFNDGCYKFYFKSQDPEFGVVKEEVDDDDSILPVDEDRIVVWAVSDRQNQSSVWQQGCSYERLDEVIKVNMPTKRSSFDPPPPLPNGGYNTTSNTACNTYRTNYESSYIKIRFHLDNYNFLGLTLVGPSDGPESADHGIYVGEIARNSVVEQSGLVKVGDKIIGINGLDVSHLNNDDAVATFRQCVLKRGAIDLVLLRHPTMHNFTRGRFTLPREFAARMDSHKQQFQLQQQATTSCQINIPIPLFDHQDLSTTTKPIKLQRQNLEQTTFSRETHSLPRSITPRSLYATSNFENSHLVSSGRGAQIDSQSAYEPTTPPFLRQLDVALHCARDDVHTIYQALKNDSKSLDIRDREWLKMIIPAAFLGSALVKWLSRNVYGFGDKREIKRYANRLLALGLIKNPPMTSGTFSEKCYYTLS